MSPGSLLLLLCTALLAAGLGAAAVLVLQAPARSRTRAAMRQRLRAAEFFRMAAEDARDGLAIHDLDSVMLWANPAYLAKMGRTADEVIGRSPLDYAFPAGERPSRSEVRAMLNDMQAGRVERQKLYRQQRGDGTLFWSRVSFGFRTTSRGETRVILVCRDVTEVVEQAEDLRRLRNRLAHEASHDALTGLANRAELGRFMDETLRSATASGEQVAVLRLDIDHFKEINDTHGHQAGDEALVCVAQRLRAALRRSDMVARVGGDEFVVICPAVPDLAALERLGRGLSAALSRPFPFNGVDLYARASIGCALSQPGQSDHHELLLQSDFALYEAKRTGRGRVVVYDEGLHRRHARLQSRAADLREAVGANALDHVFQPVVELATGRISGFETLVRWHHAGEGLISPADFLPLAEDLGLLSTIDLASMEAALAMKRRLSAAGHGQVRLSFNASSDLLRHPSFVNRLVFGTESAGMERDQIAIEVLETTVFTDHGEADSPARIISNLREAGFNVYLDDFGVGYAGLAHLAELAITGIKLDRALVRQVLSNRASAKIIATIIDLCRELGLRVIAEGVEDAATARRLQQMGCPHVQGYWLSPPVPATEALAFAAAHPGTTPLPGPQQSLTLM
ncbi:MAG: EAL domain-containing protein [Rubellimicrobium sp.]|nr:EAL domain-containing protein [Rubellimicrobium sp.]